MSFAQERCRLLIFVSAWRERNEAAQLKKLVLWSFCLNISKFHLYVKLGNCTETKTQRIRWISIHHLWKDAWWVFIKEQISKRSQLRTINHWEYHGKDENGTLYSQTLMSLKKKKHGWRWKNAAPNRAAEKTCLMRAGGWVSQHDATNWARSWNEMEICVILESDSVLWADPVLANTP